MSHGIDVWLERLDLSPESLAHAEAIVDDAERERAGRFRFPRDAQRFLAGRALLRSILGFSLEREPASIAFTYGQAGKPSVPNDRGVTFNAANSQDLVLVAVTRDVQIGVDLEHVRPVPERDLIVAQWFREDEKRVWNDLAEEQRNLAFFRWFVAKEAYLKAKGSGLGGPLTDIAIDFRDGHPLAIRGTKEWRIEQLDAPEGCVAAICVERGPTPSPIVWRSGRPARN